MRTRTFISSTLATAMLAALGCCHGELAYNTPPAQQLMQPGPGVGGPGPGVIPVGNQMLGYGAGTGGVVPASYSGAGGPGCGPGGPGGCGPGMAMGGGCMGGGMGGGVAPTSQVAFVGEEGLQIAWDIGGYGMFDASPLVVPGRQDFYQAAIYRLKLSNIPGRAGIELYPTLEIAPVTPRTDAFLAHAPIPVQFTEEDFDQVTSGNFVTKVIYLPDPEFQELALAGVETLVSTRLDPGCDPIAEADRRGSILAIVRIGNKDLQTANRGAFVDQVVPVGHQDGALPENAEGMINDPNVEAARLLHHRGHGAPQDCYDGYSGDVQGGMAMGNMPIGMPTAGFVPANVPPHMIGGGPQYGMPITGTPIGLPGPPHIPLGVPAGLQTHTMKNRTRVVLPPPTSKVAISVKQRPGMNYPRPVHHVHVDETNRAPLNLFHGTVPRPGAGALHGIGNRAFGDDAYCR
ncbi:MAG: hypothetical protein WD851_14950 [Pirellulales bacterium]